MAGSAKGVLGDKERTALRALAVSKSFKAGETIFHEGDPSDSLILIETGVVTVTRFTASGKDAILTFLNEGDVIGEIGCLSAAPRSATVAANTAVMAGVVRQADLFEALRREPDLALSFIGILCARLLATDELVMSLSALPMRARLAGGLLQLAKRHGSDTDGEGSVKLGIQVSQRDLGAFVGLSRENVSRVLAEWRDREIISSAPGGRLILHDVERLREIADAER